ncbi:MAG: hypothetical protein KJ606_01060 [Chloroflexi bacterium]|nr:hypothetical protein [Chloroflexota bacterium]
MRLAKPFWILSTLLLLILSACGGAEVTPNLNPNAVYTAAVQTAFAIVSQTAAAVTDTPTVTPIPGATLTLGPTNAPLITDTTPGGTPAATNTPFTINTPLPPTQQSCDNASLITETIPGFSEIAPGAQFVKTWRIKNTGPCIWNTNYRLAYGWGGEGTDWKTTPPALLTRVVNPGEEIDVTVTLTAPVNTGQHGAYFKMQNDKGYYFGTDLTIIIKVSGTPTP